MPMPLTIADAAVAVGADFRKFDADLAAQGGKTQSRLGKLGGAIKKDFGVVAGAVLGGIAAAGIRMGEEVDNALDSIRIGTGATGKALAGLESDFKAVAGKVPNNIEEVGQAIADLNTRTGQTGEGLQDLAVTILDFSRITKSNVAANVRNATRMFGDWSVATEDQAEALDKVFRASQATGIGVETLMQKVVDFGSPLRLLGFGMEESIALLSKWEKEGVNTESALSGLKFAVKTLATEGVPAAEMAETLQKKIASIGKSADPVGDSIELFGLRAGPDLAAAIIEGRFATEDLLEVIKNGDDTIATATKATDGFGEMWKRVTNSIKVNFGGLFTAFAGMGNLVYLLPAIGGALGKVLGMAWAKASASVGVSKAIMFASSKASTLYLAGLIAGDGLAFALKGAWTRVAGSPAVLAASRLAGAAMGSAFIAGAIGIIAAQATGDAIREAWKAATGVDLSLDFSLEGQIQKGLDRNAADAAARSGSAFMDRWHDGADKKFREFDWKDPGEAAAGAFVQGFASGTGEIGDRARWTVGEVRQAIVDGKASIVNAWKSALDERNSAANAADQIIINNAQIAAAKKVLSDKKATAVEKAEARIRIRNLRSSNQELLVEQSKYGTRAEQIAKTKALLTSKALLDGLKDKDPDVRQHWVDVQTTLTTQLGNLEGTGFVLGQGFTKGFIRGLVKDIDGVGSSARIISRTVKQYLQVRSPSEKGPFSEMGGPEGWGSRWMSLYAKGMGSGVGSVASMLSGIGGMNVPADMFARIHQGEIIVPRAQSDAIRSGQATLGAAGSGGNTFNITVQPGRDTSLAAARQFGQAVLDEVAGGLREQRARFAGSTP